MSIELPPQAWPVHEVQMIRSVDGALGKSSLAPFIAFYPMFKDEKADPASPAPARAE